MNWLYYLAEANLYLGVFYLAYCLFLSRETHYQLNRTYLLFSCVLAFALPVLKIGSLISITKPIDARANYVEPTASLANTTMQLQAVNLVAPNHPDQAMALQNNIKPLPVTVTVQSVEVIPNLTMADYLWYTYLAGVSISLVILIVRLSSLFLLARRSPRTRYGKYKLIKLPGTNIAFSFFGYLFLGDNAPAADTIIEHELVHIRQKHSADIVFVELVKIINWFNPCIYLLQNSLKTVHEYIADEQTASLKTDTLTYATFLVNTAHGVGGSAITHSFFNYSLLKKRIIMLNQKRSGNSARLKYLVAAPICAGLLCVSTLAFTKNYKWIDLDPIKNTIAKTIKTKLTDIHKNTAVDDTPVVLSAPTDNGDIALSGDKFKTDTLAITNTERTVDEDHPPVPMESAGGYDKLNRYLLKNIHYKPADGDKGGLVVMSFTVGPNRKITDLKVATSDGEVMDNLALNAFKNYPGIVNDDEGKTLKIGIFFLTDDYSIFKRPFENDPGNSGWVTITKYGYRPAITSKGYEYSEWFAGGFIVDGKMTPTVSKVRFFDKNDQEVSYSADTATPADVKLLKDKYGYIFPSNAYWASESVKDMRTHKYVPSGINLYSYLNKPYTDAFYQHIFNDLKYPEQQKNDGTPGAVLLKFNIDQNGTASDWAIAKSGGDAFDEAALDIVKSFDGTINDKAGAHTIAMVFCTVQNGKRPKVDDSWKKTPGYVGEVARGESKPITISFSTPKKQ
jgi:TonB family protein